MCKECYEMDVMDAIQFISSHFPATNKEKIIEMLKMPPINFKGLLNLIFIMRFKE